MQFWALIVDSFRESRDRKIFWVMLAISLAVATAMFCVSFEPGQIDIMFGLWKYDTQFLTGVDGLRNDLIANVVVDLIMDTVLGQIGLTLAIIATAGFFPSLMARGTVDVLVAKPIPRWKLFLGRYFGSMSFVLFHVIVFVLLTFLVVGFRWGVWLPGYLLTIPLMVLLFSYLYCVSAIVAVVLQSTVAAVLLTLGAWALFTGVQTLDDCFVMFPEWQENRLAHQSVQVARWVLPKTQDITHVARKWSGAARSTELFPEIDEQSADLAKRAAKAEAARMAVSPVKTIGSSLMFEALIVLLAMWKFARKDF